MSCTNTTLYSTHMNDITIGKEILAIVFALNKLEFTS